MKQDLAISLRLLGLAMLGALVLALLPPRTAWAGVTVSLLTLTGYGAAAAMLHLFLFPIRLRRLMPGGSLPLAGHRQIALIGLALVGFHVLGYLVLQPVSLNEITLAAPLYMQAGLIGLVLMILITVTSRLRWRQRLGQSKAGFRAPHLIGSALILAAIAIHVAGAGLWLDGVWKALSWAALSALAIVGLLRIGHHWRKPS